MDETVEVVIEKLVYGGDGFGRIDGQAVFVPGTAPGDVVRARVVERKKGFLRAEPVELVTPGPGRREPPCPLVGRCGGCQLQHVDYATQAAAKGEFVREALVRIGRLDLPGPIHVHADAEHELGYRVRATAHVARTRGGPLFGFYEARTHRIVDVPSCPLFVPELDAEWQRAREPGAMPGGTTEVEISAGDEVTIAGIRYRFGAGTFFQVNRFMLDALVDGAIGGEPGGGLALDLYAGVGLFAIPLARRFERVVAVEGNRRAADYARANAKMNGARNVQVVVEPVERWLDRAEGTADLVVLDPPRTGLGREGAAALARLAPGRIVYVSCDPATLARDARVLVDAGYVLEKVEAYDLFPQTYHVEAIMKLRREGSGARGQGSGKTTPISSLTPDP